jgi:hypothetical protein
LPEAQNLLVDDAEMTPLTESRHVTFADVRRAGQGLAGVHELDTTGLVIA